MAAYDTAVTVFEVVTILTTLMMRVSLVPDWNRWRKNKSTADMSVWPCVMIFGNSYGSLYYAYAIDNYLPLFATSILGVVVGIFMAYSFCMWATNRREVVRIFAISSVVFAVVTVYDLLALYGVTGQSQHSTEMALGFIMNAFTTLMYASPMATIIHVVRTKTATSMPFTMGLVNVLNSFCWGVYGALIHNNFLLVPNIIGVTLSLVQMLVTCIYRSKSLHAELSITASSDDLHHVVVVPDEQDVPDDCKKSAEFVALRSPCRDEAKSWRDAKQ
ncbi:hypothetical protein PHYPSEUDO_008750 [Phytophthora pseudosyringae]|uniref:Sugar transporter SWEET1 n=1 Tax=Phytophthora pseudosyringae TaxID=221518 RepID=A0A8T1VEC4_9STRA|nr:hypothetical protein PHYPSEUDO_008750 [Phytophthora pseudosyringae]